MKILHRSIRGEAQKESSAAQLQVEKPATRRLRAGVFCSFRRSSGELSRKKFGVDVSWKKYEQRRPEAPSPSPYKGDVAFKANEGGDEDDSARTCFLWFSSIATAEMTIPTDGSMGATTSTNSSLCREGDASFLQATETFIETKEVLIPTVDGQIEAQRQECTVTDMHHLDAVTIGRRLLDEEDASSVALDDFKVDEDEKADCQSQQSSRSEGTNGAVFFSDEGSQVDDIGVGHEQEETEDIFELDADMSVPYDDEQEREGDDDENVSDYDDEYDEESREDAKKGATMLQSLFLSGLPDDDYESSFAEDQSYDGDSRTSKEGTFASAFDAFEEFAAESIYSASLLFLGPPEAEKKRKKRKNRRRKNRAEKDSVSVTTNGSASQADPP